MQQLGMKKRVLKSARWTPGLKILKAISIRQAAAGLVTK
jgi:hypothetical protein